MECSEVSSRLLGYLSDDLPPRMQRDIAEHLRGCYCCTEELNELTSVVETCRDALRFPVPYNRFEELRPFLRKPNAVLPRPRHFVRNAVASLAAAGLVIAFGWLLIPAVQTTVHLARLPERASQPEQAKAIGDKATRGSSRMPMATLLAWSQKIGDEDALIEDRQEYRVSEPEVKNLPPTTKPVSMREKNGHKRLVLADATTTRS